MRYSFAFPFLFLGMVTSEEHTVVKRHTTDLKIVCYFSNWAAYRPGLAKFTPENINPYLCTHLIYAFAALNKDYELKPYDPYNDIEQGNYKKFVGLKTYNPKLKMMVAIGGWNEGSKRCETLYTFVTQETREAFDNERTPFGKDKLILSVAVPAGKDYIDKGFDIATITKNVDFMNILAYDYHTAYEDETEHHAPLLKRPDFSEWDERNDMNVEWTVDYYLKLGVVPEKLVLGIPTYGRSYTLLDPEDNGIEAPVDGPGEEGPSTRETGYMAYYEICQNILDEGWVVHRPYPEMLGPYAYKDDQWVCFDDEKMVVEKAKFILKRGLGGAMVWTLDTDDFRGLCGKEQNPLVNTLRKVLFSNTIEGFSRLYDTDDHDRVYSPSVEGDKKRPSRTHRRRRPGFRRVVRPRTTTESQIIKDLISTPAPPPTPDPDPSFTCPGEGFFRNTRDCRKYFWCLDSGPAALGLVPHAFTCPSGLYFHTKMEACDYPENVNCNNLPVAQTTPSPRPTRRLKLQPPTTTTELSREVEKTVKNTLNTYPSDKTNLSNSETLSNLLHLIQSLGGLDQLKNIFGTEVDVSSALEKFDREDGQSPRLQTLPDYVTPKRAVTEYQSSRFQTLPDYVTPKSAVTENQSSRFQTLPDYVTPKRAVTENQSPRLQTLPDYVTPKRAVSEHQSSRLQTLPDYVTPKRSPTEKQSLRHQTLSDYVTPKGAVSEYQSPRFQTLPDYVTPKRAVTENQSPRVQKIPDDVSPQKAVSQDEATQVQKLLDFVALQRAVIEYQLQQLKKLPDYISLQRNVTEDQLPQLHKFSDYVAPQKAITEDQTRRRLKIPDHVASQRIASEGQSSQLQRLPDYIDPQRALTEDQLPRRKKQTDHVSSQRTATEDQSSELQKQPHHPARQRTVPEDQSLQHQKLPDYVNRQRAVTEGQSPQFRKLQDNLSSQRRATEGQSSQFQKLPDYIAPQRVVTEDQLPRLQKLPNHPAPQRTVTEDQSPQRRKLPATLWEAFTEDQLPQLKKLPKHPTPQRTVTEDQSPQLQKLPDYVHSQRTATEGQLPQIEKLQDRVSSQGIATESQSSQPQKLPDYVASKRVVTEDESPRLKKLPNHLASQRTTTEVRSSKLQKLPDYVNSQRTATERKSPKVEKLQDNVSPQRTVRKGQSARLRKLSDHVDSQRTTTEDQSPQLQKLSEYVVSQRISTEDQSSQLQKLPDYVLPPQKAIEAPLPQIKNPQDNISPQRALPEDQSPRFQKLPNNVSPYRNATEEQPPKLQKISDYVAPKRAISTENSTPPVTEISTIPTTSPLRTSALPYYRIPYSPVPYRPATLKPSERIDYRPIDQLTSRVSRHFQYEPLEHSDSLVEYVEPTQQRLEDAKNHHQNEKKVDFSSVYQASIKSTESEDTEPPTTQATSPTQELYSDVSSQVIYETPNDNQTLATPEDLNLTTTTEFPVSFTPRSDGGPRVYRIPVQVRDGKVVRVHGHIGRGRRTRIRVRPKAADGQARNSNIPNENSFRKRKRKRRLGVRRRPLLTSNYEDAESAEVVRFGAKQIFTREEKDKKRYDYIIAPDNHRAGAFRETKIHISTTEEPTTSILTTNRAPIIRRKIIRQYRLPLYQPPLPEVNKFEIITERPPEVSDNTQPDTGQASSQVPRTKQTQLHSTFSPPPRSTTALSTLTTTTKRPTTQRRTTTTTSLEQDGQLLNVSGDDFECLQRGVFRHPHDCGVFLFCVPDDSENGFRKIVHNCPDGRIYMEEIGRCIVGDRATCESLE
ncbi:titin-like [Limulus polyphemus]|uniref:Titin-like n=1 Tax=Limulus polyphemus TaxID=6850 RepID=A0ABM1TAJ6_LIMPO|nr:titin-like [Limulus polyphemus]